jgi:hypothetical protein
VDDNDDGSIRGTTIPLHTTRRRRRRRRRKKRTLGVPSGQ